MCTHCLAIYIIYIFILCDTPQGVFCDMHYSGQMSVESECCWPEKSLFLESNSGVFCYFSVTDRFPGHEWCLHLYCRPELRFFVASFCPFSLYPSHLLCLWCISSEEWQQARRSLATALLLEMEHLTSSVCQNLEWTDSRTRTHIRKKIITNLHFSFRLGLLGQPVWVWNQFSAFYFSVETEPCRNIASGEAIEINSIMTTTIVMENKLKSKSPWKVSTFLQTIQKMS